MIPLTPETVDNIVTLLLVKGRLTNEQVESVSNADGAQNVNGNVLSQLLENEFCSEQDIAASIADSYGLPEVTLTPDNLDKVAANLLPKSFLEVNHVLPFAVENKTLKVAIADPSKLTIVPSVRVITKFEEIEIYVTTFANLIECLYWLGITAAVPATDDMVSPEPKDSLKIKSDEPSSDVIEFVNTVVREAISNKASDIHIERAGGIARIRFRVDGVLYKQRRFSDFLEEHYSAVSTRIKIMCNANISERRLPQDGAIPFDIAKGIDLRVNFLPTHGGSERVVMRILNKKGLSVKLEQLGLDEKNGLPKLLAAVNAPQGMVLITGPTGSGKTTTLYSLLQLINKEGVNILTAEDPVEYALEGIGQVQVREDIGFSFAAALRSFLRQDPEVILIGEIRDKETVEIAVKAALTGHLVFSTLHTNDAPSSITRLIDMGIPPYLVASAVSLVMAQRLARKNCAHCAKPQDGITSDQLLELGYSAEEASTVKPQRGKGCGKCDKTGYGGRQGIYEILKITPELRDIIQVGGDMKALNTAARKEGFKTLSETGRELMQQGTLSIEEYQRVLVTG